MICDRIRALREGTGKSARKFAEEIGIKYTTYYGYETGSREPGSDTLVALAKYYNVTTDYILGIEKTPVPAEADTGEKVDAMEVYRALIAMGYVKEGEDLTDSDLAFLIGVGEIIRAWFESRGQ